MCKVFISNIQVYRLFALTHLSNSKKVSTIYFYMPLHVYSGRENKQILVSCNYICFAFISHFDIAYNIQLYIRILVFPLFILIIFAILLFHFSQNLIHIQAMWSLGGREKVGELFENFNYFRNAKQAMLMQEKTISELLFSATNKKQN